MDCGETGSGVEGGTGEPTAFLRAREDAGLDWEGLGGVGENRFESH